MDTFDESLANGIKFLVDYTFFRFGLEVGYSNSFANFQKLLIPVESHMASAHTQGFSGELTRRPN
jgi:lysozyme family protein